MKKILCIVVLTLGILGYSYGQAPSGRGEVAGVAEKSAPAAPGGVEIQAAETAGSSGSEEPAASAITGSGPSSTAPAARRTTGRGTTSARELSSESAPTGAVTGPVSAKPSIIKLRDQASGASYGPFEVSQGAQVRIGDKAYIIEVEQVGKSQAQIRLEEKLRTTVPDLTFEGASIGEIVDYLSSIGELNIVVTNEVRERVAATITLRLKNIPLLDAIRYVTEVVDICFRVDDHAVVITMPETRPGVAPTYGTGESGGR